jgi:hypothetical protein
MRGRAAAGVLLLALIEGAVAHADGGRLRSRQVAGPFAVAVFTAPEPLAAGAADISVLVQDRVSGEVVLDAEVTLELSGPGPARAIAAGAGANRLLKAAVVDLAPAGLWTLGVAVRRGAAAARVSCELPVGAPASRLSAIWPLLALPPLAVVLFALRPRRKR